MSCKIRVNARRTLYAATIPVRIRTRRSADLHFAVDRPVFGQALLGRERPEHREQDVQETHSKRWLPTLDNSLERAADHRASLVHLLGRLRTGQQILMCKCVFDAAIYLFQLMDHRARRV